VGSARCRVNWPASIFGKSYERLRPFVTRLSLFPLRRNGFSTPARWHSQIARPSSDARSTILTWRLTASTRGRWCANRRVAGQHGRARCPPRAGQDLATGSRLTRVLSRYCADRAVLPDGSVSWVVVDACTAATGQHQRRAARVLQHAVELGTVGRRRDRRPTPAPVVVPRQIPADLPEDVSAQRAQPVSQIQYLAALVGCQPAFKCPLHGLVGSAQPGLGRRRRPRSPRSRRSDAGRPPRGVPAGAGTP